MESIRSVEELGRIQHAVVVVAHPDDETFCSGFICQLIELGATVDLLCLTRGEGGPTGAWTREELGEAREVEMRKACEKLGIRELKFLGHIDPVAGEHRVYAPPVSVDDLARQITPYLESADFVITHGSSGEYWHPAHLLVHKAVELAIGEGSWATFLAARENHPISKLVNLDDSANFILDVSGQSSARREALASHESQVSLFCRFANGTLDDFISKTSREDYCIRGREIG
ncbi:MAG: PIG-L family deacetylase [Verrucomicrobiales bacterium]|nr:PIG-L family deacetylase [Verrucomicrobiales bacterium]